MEKQIKKILKLRMTENDIQNFAELSKKSGICRQTLYDRMDNPGSFRLYEISTLDSLLHFTNEDLNYLVRMR